MNVSKRGVELVANFEGFRSNPYRDAVGVWTIGYGHTKGVGPNTKPISRAKAFELLKDELNHVYAKPVRALGIPLNQNQFDALVSFVYNVGPGGVSKDTKIGRALRARRYVTAANLLLDWDKAGGKRLEGLSRRRRAERALFLRKSTRRERWAASLKRTRRIANSRRRKNRKVVWTQWLRNRADKLKRLLRRK